MITLYEAEHNISKLKYFAKTELYHTVEDLQRFYHGSGKYWKNHLKKHDDDVTMKILHFSNDIKLINSLALMYSKFWNIVESKDYANLKPENGLDGWVLGQTSPNFGKKTSHKVKLKISNSLINYHKNNINGFFGKTHSPETLALLSTKKLKFLSNNLHPMLGKTHSKESKEKMRNKVYSKESKEKMSQSAIGKHCSSNNGMFGNISVRDLRNGNCYVVTKEFFYENKFNKTNGYLVGSRSKINNFKD